MSEPPLLVLLDTNAYLRLAKRIRPFLGVIFGAKQYKLMVLPDVEREVRASGRLKFLYPWFEDADLAAERMATRIRLNEAEKVELNKTATFLRDWVLDDVARFTTGGRQPPGSTDCRVLAFAKLRGAIVVTDDLGMHALAGDFKMIAWHGPDLLAKMRSAKVVTNDLIREVYAALEANGDLTASWNNARHTTFKKVFGKSR